MRTDLATGVRYHPAEPINPIPGQWLITGLGLSAAALLLMMRDEHVRIFFSPLATCLYALTAGVVALLHLRRSDGNHAYPALREFSGHAVMFMAISLMGAIASYPEAAASTGYADPRLERIDQALHFDWLSWYRMVCAHPALQWCGRAAYCSIYATPAALLGWFAANGRRAEARLFLVDFWIAAILTLLLFHWVPAKGPLAMLWRGPIPYMPTSALYQAQMIPELRTHVLTRIDLGALRGLVCAPSFHTTAAVIFAFTAWPIRSLRWHLLAINAAMLLATPVEGTHYLADMLGGALVAVASILLTLRVAQHAQGPAAFTYGSACP